MNRVVAAIWSFMLVATGAAVVPIVVRLLQRALRAALNIERYTSEILTSGVGIAGNTANVAALKATLGVAPRLVDGATSIRDRVETIESVLGPDGAKAEEATP